jgi:hypothetical protein
MNVLSLSSLSRVLSLPLSSLFSLYLSDASGHQKAYKELLAHVDAGNAVSLDDV